MGNTLGFVEGINILLQKNAYHCVMNYYYLKKTTRFFLCKV